MQNELQSLKTIFDSNNIPISLDWLRECIDWCKSEVLNSNYTLDQLKNAIHDQWLNLDLRDIETKVLPPGLSDKQYMVLNGNFSLQLMKIVDISKPKYWQLQQIRKENVLTRPSGNEVRETIGSGKRVLQLTLTDGVQYVEAMEYKPIQILNINLTPGVKIRLSGPLTIRRGRLMLQEQNIRILGGEVEELLIPNAAENVLASALNLPLNNNPNIIDMKLLTVEQESENVLSKSNPKQDKKINHPITSTVMNPTITKNAPKSQNTNNFSTASTAIQDDFPTDEDMELLMMAENNGMVGKNDANRTFQSINKCEEPTDEEMELLMEMEKEHVRNNRNIINKTPDLFEDDFDPDQIEELIEKKTLEIKQEPKPGTSSNKRKLSPLRSEPLKKVVVAEQASQFGDFVNEDLFADLDLEGLQKKEDAKLTVSKVVELKTKIRNNCAGSFRIKAKFKAIEKKVTVQGDEYKAEMRIEDDSDDMVCKVHSDIISKWAGLTPNEMLDLRKSILSGNVEFKNKVQNILQVIMKKILEVDNLMEIQLNGCDSLPIMKEIFY
ncbi:recQ-mediated genome instability protein 1-like isoform X1 [Harmonia axyridis]|uniref:recQ-mediated genome instability protein 1-like isoform X1 n=2 Tax=Harmonia axyridis TaxID=115357 RepID=UPI001E27839F|nr:recQ-mediated genome instability protein 1-like isoform X1 [Harmonia axyridis]